MPRYCAAICCKNRRGRNSKDRKLSFYPFPLHDKERLAKWLKNMKRDSWMPSKYQFLCSDHFTPDSLDIRWGIRYLKHTAIPTIFSLPEDSQEKEPSKRSCQKKKTDDEKEVCPKAESQESFVAKQPETNTVSTGLPHERAEPPRSPAMAKPPAGVAGSGHSDDVLALNLVTQEPGEPEPALEAPTRPDIGTGGSHTSFEDLNSTAITLTTSNVEGIRRSLETQEVLEITTNHFAYPNVTNNSMDIKSAQENPFLLSTITQTVEELNTNKESVIAILVPTENARPPIHSFVAAQKETVEAEDPDADKDADYEADVLQIEHSYCKQDINKEHLWQKVSKLHSKITLLELQEQQTLGRLKSLEALIRQLRQENWLSEENVKIIENHFTTYEVTMI